MFARIASPTFIGRSEELARLVRALEEARAGKTRGLLVAGEAGIGKSRLIAELGERAEAEGVRILSGGCIDLGENGVPYAPIVEALRTWVHRADEAEIELAVGRWRAELARLVPDLGPAEDTSPGSAGTLSIGSAQGRLFELFLGVVQRLAARNPIVLVVEDMHWSDRSTRDLLAFLLRNLRDVPVLQIMSYRSDELHRRHPLLPFVAELERSGRVERLDLCRLDRREVAAQLRAIAGAELDPERVDSIFARSEGNPFFAEELLAGGPGADTHRVPPTLRDVLLARIAGLPESVQEFLRVASAAGSRIDSGLLAGVAEMDAGAVHEALRVAVDRNVLVPLVVAGAERYAFRHALLKEAVYDELLPGEKTQLHARFAATLGEDRLGAESAHLPEIAHHWYAAHDLPRAFDAALLAAAAAESSYAFPEAQAHYERALELWDRVPDAAGRAGCERTDLLASAASVARFHDPDRAVAHIRTALALVDQAADPVPAGLLEERLGRYAWLAGQGELALDAYRSAVRLVPAEPASEARARVLAGLAQILMLQRRYADSRRLSEAAVVVARSVGARQIEGHALNTRAVDRVQDGEVDAALADLDEALRIAEEVGNLDDIGRAYGNRLDVLSVAGRLEDAVVVAGDAVDVARRLGLLTFFGTHYLWNAANFLYRLGRWQESEAAAREAEEIGALGINVFVREVLARLAVARGGFDDAARELEALRPIALRAGDGQAIAPVHASLAELTLWRRRPAEAAEVAAAGIEALAYSVDLRHAELYALAIRAQADLAERARARRSGRDATAAIAAGRSYAEIIRRWHAMMAERPALASQSAAWLALSEAESSRLEGSPAPDAWRAAADAWEGLGQAYAVAYARWRESEAILAGRGDRHRAVSTLGRAIETAAVLGAEPLRREAEALAQRARLRLVSPSLAATEEPTSEAIPYGLTRREVEVLALVALGRTNRQIGETLFISEMTAGVHVSNILGKLGVAGRGEAAALAHSLGITESLG